MCQGQSLPSLLPGRESLWDTLYASSLDEQAGRAPVLRLTNETCSFSVFTSKAHNYEKLSAQNTVIAITLDP